MCMYACSHLHKRTYTYTHTYTQRPPAGTLAALSQALFEAEGGGRLASLRLNTHSALKALDNTTSNGASLLDETAHETADGEQTAATRVAELGERDDVLCR